METITEEKWTPVEAKHHRNTARSLFAHSYDHVEPDPNNCGGCALISGDEDGPNYAGWARVYVEAGRTIPREWTRAFQSERNSSNAAYAAALRKSINTFGHPGYCL